jgi:hypothetical protein
MPRCYTYVTLLDMGKKAPFRGPVTINCNSVTDLKTSLSHFFSEVGVLKTAFCDTCYTTLNIYVRKVINKSIYMLEKSLAIFWQMCHKHRVSNM